MRAGPGAAPRWPCCSGHGPGPGATAIRAGPARSCAALAMLLGAWETGRRDEDPGRAQATPPQPGHAARGMEPGRGTAAAPIRGPSCSIRTAAATRWSVRALPPRSHAAGAPYRNSIPILWSGRTRTGRERPTEWPACRGCAPGAQRPRRARPGCGHGRGAGTAGVPPMSRGRPAAPFPASPLHSPTDCSRGRAGRDARPHERTGAREADG